MEQNVMHTAITCITRNPLQLKKQHISIGCKATLQRPYRFVSSINFQSAKDVFLPLDIKINSDYFVFFQDFIAFFWFCYYFIKIMN